MKKLKLDCEGILNAIKQTIEENGEPYHIEDAVHTLVYTILLHFVRMWRIQMDKSHEQLINLRCLTLSYIKWYKDVFLSKVLQWDDSNGDFWKEKFIFELLTLFIDKNSYLLIYLYKVKTAR